MNSTAAARVLDELTGIEAQIGPEIVTLRHTVMHYRITMTCFDADFASGVFDSPDYVESRWLRPAQLADFPVSSPQRKLAAALTPARPGDQ